MKPYEAFRTLCRMGPQDANVIATYFVDHFQELRLNSGMPLANISDVQHFLREFAIVSRVVPDFPERMEVPAPMTPTEISSRSKATRPAQRRWDEFCPDCGHIHADDSECGFPQGGGRERQKIWREE
jgi:hypothetical protein